VTIFTEDGNFLEAALDLNTLARLKAVAARQTLTLTHYGRKSGKPYDVAIWFVVDGDKVYIGTANVNRQWVRNVQRTPRVKLSIGAETFDGTAPTKNPIQPANAGGGDAYVAKVNPAGTALVYSTYLGGSDFDLSSGTAVGRTGKAYAVGLTFSTDFPTMNPIQAAKAGEADTDDVFVTLFNAAGNGIVYSTYLGGSGYDESGGVVLDPVGNESCSGRSDVFHITKSALGLVQLGPSDFFLAVHEQ